MSHGNMNKGVREAYRNWLETTKNGTESQKLASNESGEATSTSESKNTKSLPPSVNR